METILVLPGSSLTLRRAAPHDPLEFSCTEVRQSMDTPGFREAVGGHVRLSISEGPAMATVQATP